MTAVISRRRQQTCSTVRSSLFAKVFFYFVYSPAGGCEVLQAACLCVCLSVSSHISKATCPDHEIFCTFHLWPRLRPPPMTVRYVMYFRFRGWHHVFL